jgi:hypothetical protein
VEVGGALIALTADEYRMELTKWSPGLMHAIDIANVALAIKGGVDLTRLGASGASAIYGRLKTEYDGFKATRAAAIAASGDAKAVRAAQIADAEAQALLRDLENMEKGRRSRCARPARLRFTLGLGRVSRPDHRADGRLDGGSRLPMEPIRRRPEARALAPGRRCRTLTRGRVHPNPRPSPSPMPSWKISSRARPRARWASGTMPRPRDRWSCRGVGIGRGAAFRISPRRAGPWSLIEHYHPERNFAVPMPSSPDFQHIESLARFQQGGTLTQRVSSRIRFRNPRTGEFHFTEYGIDPTIKAPPRPPISCACKPAPVHGWTSASATCRDWNTQIDVFRNKSAGWGSF